LEFEGGAWSKFEEAIEGTVELPVLVDNAGRFFGIGGAGLFVGVLGTVGSTKRGDLHKRNNKGVNMTQGTVSLTVCVDVCNANWTKISKFWFVEVTFVEASGFS
jgi:hypothetical protein